MVVYRTTWQNSDTASYKAAQHNENLWWVSKVHALYDSLISWYKAMLHIHYNYVLHFISCLRKKEFISTLIRISHSQTKYTKLWTLTLIHSSVCNEWWKRFCLLLLSLLADSTFCCHRWTIFFALGLFQSRTMKRNTHISMTVLTPCVVEKQGLKQW